MLDANQCDTRDRSQFQPSITRFDPRAPLRDRNIRCEGRSRALPLMIMTPAGRIERRLVLVGGGHAHVGVLRAFAMEPEAGLEITLIAKELDAPYSGMLPGFVAGHYDLAACHIDIVRLAHFAGARLVHGEADGIDGAARRVSIAGRPPITFDLLSVDTGITPAIDDIEGAAKHAVAVKPVSSFAPRWQTLMAAALTRDGPRRIAVIGTGAAGFELILAIRHRLRNEANRHGLSPESFSFALIGSGPLLASHNARARRLAEIALTAAGVDLVTADAAVAVRADHVLLASGRKIAADATLVTTKAAPPTWFVNTGLPTDARGFLAVEPTLQVVGQQDIFAVGDCATVLAHPREKAGVFAVRQGPALVGNIRMRSRGLAARPFVPQSRFLTLLSCGGERAIAARGGLAAEGHWAWRLKDYIDRAFMRRFQDLPAPRAESGEDTPELLCSGCAAKLGPAPLARALQRFSATMKSTPVSRTGLVNLAPGDDAAVLDLGGGDLRVESVDQFPAIWPEPYVLGEIAAAHALSDVFAKGGRADHALALAGLPPAASHLQEDDLFQLLAGARSVFDAEGVTLVGGHTSRMDALTVGFFVSGSVERDRWLPKGGLRGGEVLLLTKPLGTGIIFAGWMRRLADAREVSAAISGMRRSNGPAARLLGKHGAVAATDVTGFGLAGHLLEMLAASGVTAEIGLDAIPRYQGTDRLARAGVRSSLLPDNLAVASRIDIEPGDRASEDAAHAILLDPQTSGGLLAAVAPGAAGRALAALADAGIEAAAIGAVTAAEQGDRSAGRLVIRRARPAILDELLPGTRTTRSHEGIKTS
jgi:selenide,water dikinase